MAPPKVRVAAKDSAGAILQSLVPLNANNAVSSTVAAGSSHYPQKRTELLAHWTAIRNSYVLQEAEARAEILRQHDSYRKDIAVFEAHREKNKQKEDHLRKLEAEKVLGMFPARRAALFEEEYEGRAKKRILEEKVRRSLGLMFRAELRSIDIADKRRKLFNAEEAKRYYVERCEEQETFEFAEKFKKTPWKPTLWMLGQCPFAKKKECPFSNGLCHGLNVPPKHFAASLPDNSETGIGDTDSDVDIFSSNSLDGAMRRALPVDVGPSAKEIDALESPIKELSIARVH